VESDDAGGVVDVGQGEAPFRTEDSQMMVPRSPYRVITMFLMTGLEMAENWAFCMRIIFRSEIPRMHSRFGAIPSQHNDHLSLEASRLNFIGSGSDRSP